MTTHEKALVAALIPHLEWRHHGIGCLQAYVRENAEPEVRVHIWHPLLVRPGIRESGDIHDHRFDLESTVLYGRIVETRYREEDAFDRMSTSGPAMLGDIWNVQNARAAGPEVGFDGTCVKTREHVLIMVSAPSYYSPDDAVDTYTVPRGVFHKTVVEGLTITVCTLREKREQARILTPHGKEPVHAFGAPCAAATQGFVLDEALRALGGA